MEIYLDNSATTRAFPEVAEKVAKVMTEDYGNPSSMHMKGVDAEKYIKEVELSMSNIFFGNEVPIFLKFLHCYLSLILEEYDDETIKIMKNCYNDMKQLNPGAVQLVWIKRELTENGIAVE